MELFKNQNLKVIIVFLLIVNLAMLGYIIYLKKVNPQFDNRYPLIDISRNFISQEHYLTNIQPLREKMKAMSEEFGIDSVSIYIEYLNTGANISINPENYVWPASLTKVPLAMAVVKKIEKGDWEFYNELVLLQGDRDSKSGDSKNPLSEYPIGTRFTIEKLLEELLVKSDNTAYYVLLRNLHQDDLKEVIQAMGLESLFTDEGKVSAKEYSRILRSLYTASFLSRENSERILKWLDDSKFDEFLSRGIEDDIPFPHKYGEHIALNAYSDSGIVYIPNRPYVISVMVQGESEKPYEEERERVASFMGEISREAYEYFSKASN